MAHEIENFSKLLQRIEIVCKKSGRNSRDITVLAVTKYANIDQINQVISAGISHIGENKIQDAQKKFSLLLPAKKHFIGHLQANKVKAAVKLFDVIESVDRFELAEILNHECSKLNKIMPILIQVNVANDPNKFGISVGQALSFARSLQKFSFLQIQGFMTIVPFNDNPETVRPYFRTMKTLFDFTLREFPEVKTLSMGMSQDFEVAIEEGATEIRIGSSLFQN